MSTTPTIDTAGRLPDTLTYSDREWEFTGTRESGILTVRDRKGSSVYLVEKVETDNPSDPLCYLLAKQTGEEGEVYEVAVWVTGRVNCTCLGFKRWEKTTGKLCKHCGAIEGILNQFNQGDRL